MDVDNHDATRELMWWITCKQSARSPASLRPRVLQRPRNLCRCSMRC